RDRIGRVVLSTDQEHAPLLLGISVRQRQPSADFRRPIHEQRRLAETGITVEDGQLAAGNAAARSPLDAPALDQIKALAHERRRWEFADVARHRYHLPPRLLRGRISD